jgi:hypothetical protein
LHGFEVDSGALGGGEDVVSKRSLTGLAGFLLWLAAAGPAVGTTLTIQVGDAEAVDIAGAGGTQAIGDMILWTLPASTDDPYTDVAGIEIAGMSALLKEDPFVTLNASFINPTGFTQTYTLTITLPIPGPGFAYNATVGSSVGVTVTDTVGGSVSASSVSPDGIYSGQVNGVTILTLMPHSTSVSCPPPPGVGCSAATTDNSGLPLSPVTPGVATSIGIQLKFTLTAFDQVGVTSRFEIVPEPSAFVLLGIACAALVVSRSRAA